MKPWNPVFLILLLNDHLVSSQTTDFTGQADALVQSLKSVPGADKNLFSCAGNQQALCPDAGTYRAAGGNLTLTILDMHNLPDLDGFGLAGLETDAYIRVTIGQDTLESDAVRNSLNPHWPACAERWCTGPNDLVRDLNFGNRLSGELIRVDVLDSDSGLEFFDDTIKLKLPLRVIYCSAFTAPVQRTPHGTGDGLWHMPEQPVCVEESWISLNGIPCLDDAGLGNLSPDAECIHIRQTVIPFQLNIEETHVDDVLVNGGMAGYYEEDRPRIYGRVYSGSDTRLARFPSFLNAQGGLLLRSDSASLNAKGNASLLTLYPEYPYIPYCRFTINFDAEMYVFRRKPDVEVQTLDWLGDQFGWQDDTDQAYLFGADEDSSNAFLARHKSVKATYRNEYGDARGKGEITGMNKNWDYNDNTLQMYFIVLVPEQTSFVQPPQYSRSLDLEAFLLALLQYGITFSALVWLNLRFLQSMHWRLNRVEVYLLRWIEHPDDVDESDDMKKSGQEQPPERPLQVLRYLFVCYNDSDRNLEFRRNLYYAKLAVWTCLSCPFWIGLAWGATVVTTVKPPTVGLFMLFIGFGSFCAYIGVIRWHYMGWRMTHTTLVLFFLSFLCTFLFLLSVTFKDPKVSQGGEPMDFSALTAVSLTLNMMPMIWLAFTNDSKIMKSLNQVLAVVTTAKKVHLLKSKFKNLGTLGLKLGLAKGQMGKNASKNKQDPKERPKGAFDAIMGDHYSVVSTIPAFAAADILQNAFVLTPERKKFWNPRCYGISVATLVCYSIIAASETNYPLQGLSVSCTVVFTDFSMGMLLRGPLTWSAGYIVYLMSGMRMALTLFSGQYWILSQSSLCMLFGTALCREIVGKNLPRMSAAEAGGITFFGHQRETVPNYDLSTTPEFVLFFNGFIFLFMLLAVVFVGSPDTTDPEILVPVFGQEWSLWIFGLLAFVLVLFYGIALGTSRAFFLMKEQLLSDYASKAYLYFTKMKLPMILAAAAELLIVCSGMFIYASTKSTFILELSVFGPLILLLVLVVYLQWRKNDYRLVIWPPEEDELLDEDDLEDELFDEEEEFEKEAEALRDAFVLPPLEKDLEKGQASSNFKMPALPIKGALMKVKAKTMLDPKTLKTKTSSIVQEAGAATKPKEEPPLDDRAKDSTSPSEDAANEKEQDGQKDNDNAPTSSSGNPQSGVEESVAEAKDVTSEETPKKTESKKGCLTSCFSKLRHPFSKYQQVGNTATTTTTKSGEGITVTQNNDSRDDEEEPIVDFSSMTLSQAFFQSYLLPEDYITLGCFAALLLIIFLFGLIVSATESPAWLGNLIWVGCYVTIFTLTPLVKWFNVLEVTTDMRWSYGLSFLLAWISGFVLFFQVMKGSVNDVESLIILSILILYPIALLLFATLYKWRDDAWVISNLTRTALPTCLVFLSLWIFEMFAWGGTVFGGVLLFLFATFLTALYFLTKWIENDFYISPRDQRHARVWMYILASVFLSVGLVTNNEYFGFSIACILFLLKYAGTIVGIRMTRTPDLEIFYSPYIFPVFSYDAKTTDVCVENAETIYLYRFLLTTYLWAVVSVMFGTSLFLGVGLSSLTLLVTAGTSAHLCCVTPIKMGIAAKFVTESMLTSASVVAKDALEFRRQELVIESSEYAEQERREAEAEMEFQKVSLGHIMSQSSTQEKLDLENPKNKPRTCAADLALEMENLESHCRETRDTQGLVYRRVDSFFTSKDAFMDVFRGGHGPLAYLGLCGYLWKLYLRLNQRKATLISTNSCRVYTLTGRLRLPLSMRQQNLDQNLDSEDDRHVVLVDSLRAIQKLESLDRELDVEFCEETRCIIHFQLLILNASEARLARERVLFQKFLRENRFKLMSNGINPPSNIFKTTSFASIDIPLVALWLMSLTVEERARFHNLKAGFSHDMERKDELVDAEEEQLLAVEEEHFTFLKQRELLMCRRRYQEFQARRARRAEDGSALDPEEDEMLVNAHESLAEIESGWSCEPGQFGRSLQFMDPEFQPSATSIEGCKAEHEILEWKVSTGINISAGLFDGGTDPDDVHQGKLQNAWFLSALSIIAASGGVDDGKVDALIDRLFITKQTSLTGAYAVQLWKNAQWESVIVDDFFPTLDLEVYRDDDCAGAAFGHAKHFEELWVPLIEKAYAKYHGGYAMLEHGYVHQALRDLTGAESFSISLASASRGARKKKLWQELLEYKTNRFLMGAGSLTSDHVDREILDTGLVFGACYIVYDVRSMDGHHLLQLRNPPGDHAEWRGDWGDESDLWTRRLKSKLGWSDNAEDNTFWMSFDDFCNAFRCLYVCRYYDPKRWRVETKRGIFAGDTSAGLPTRHNPQSSTSSALVENNWQYKLDILRPSEITIVVSQVDAADLASPVIHPLGMYLVSNPQPDRATRVTELTKDNVVASAGEPRRERQLMIHATLKPRTYTLLIAPYVAGLEGPFRLSVTTNFEFGLEQLWPPPWKEAKEPTTMAEKMVHRVKQTLAESDLKNKLVEQQEKLRGKLAQGTAALDEVMKDDAALLEEELKAKDEAKKPKKKNPWIEQWEESVGKPFYYNKKTGMSSWEKPEDYDDYD